jgi:hypothetical protein
MVSQGSQSLALGLAKTAATQLDDFVLARHGFLGEARARGRSQWSVVSERKLNHLLIESMNQ